MNKTFHAKLHRWYAAHGRRDLPWRNTRDAYHIYISEIMLQQTQVKTVLERFYFQFLKAFPTLKKLANAPEEKVLKHWQGLGYYNRARNLHRGAKECGIELPCTVEALIALPGIGRNTAHAIAAFAYHQPVAVMEANVKRVVSRIFALETPSEKELWEKATELLDAKKPFDYNQAMMDVGAMICTPRAPKCESCPANAICLGKDAPEKYPAKRSKKIVPVRKKHIVVEHDGKGGYHAGARKGKFLGGLYHFSESDAKPKAAQHIGTIRQQYSHFTLEAEVYLLQLPPPLRGRVGVGGGNWYSLAQLKKLPMSGAEQKILRQLEAVNGNCG